MENSNTSKLISQKINLSEIIGMFFAWWYREKSVDLRKIVVATIKLIYHLFSIPYLFKTLFAPWRRDIENKVNPSIQDMFRMFVDNLISRIIGAIVRFFTIIAGVVILFLVSVASVVILIFWFTFPLVFVTLLIFAVYKIL